MSLINQMLKDLAKRTSATDREEVILSGLSVLAQKETINKSTIAFFVSIFFIVFAFFAISSHIHVWTAHKEKTDLTSQDVSSNVLNKQLSEIAPITQEKVTEIPSILTGIAMQNEGNDTQVRLLLNQNTLYKINMDSPQKLELYLDKTNVVTDLPPLNYLKSSVANLEMNDTPEGLMLTFSLLPNTTIKHIDYSNAGELEIDFSTYDSANTISSAGAGNFIKKPVSDFNAEQQYENAVNLLDSGNTKEAIEQFDNILTAHPEHKLARSSLVSALLQQNQLKDAQTVLRKGMLDQPSYIPYVQLQAEIFMREERIAQALSTLRAFSPPITENTSYYALMAALFQRNDQFDLAASLYKQLLTIEPNNGVWQMGLGIALESQGKDAEAKEFYTQAANNTTLDPESKAFVEGKI